MKRTTLRVAAFALLLGWVGGCQRATPAADDGSSSLPAPAIVAPLPSAAASSQPVLFSGGYAAERHRIETSRAQDRLAAWDDDDGSQAAGPGTLAITLDPSGVASGTAAGALGDQLVSGALDGDTLRLKLVPAVPSASVPFAGVVLATRVGVGYEGELQVSSGDSKLIRRGTVTLAPTPAR